jgi:hypothetical protein
MLTLLTALALCQLDGGVLTDSARADAPRAEAADAGRAPIVVLDVLSGALVVRPEDGGTPSLVHVGDGCYEPTESCMRVAKEHASDEGELDQARKIDAKWLFAAFGGGALVGLAVGIAVGIFSPIHPKGP